MRCSSAVSRWFAALAALLLAALLTGCAGLPPRCEPAPSTAFVDTDGTALAKIAAASRPPGETAPSGFRLLPTGEFAFNARLALMQRAERSLDLQYYHIHRDQAGRALLRELRDAAARGVRVRLLVDDFYAAEIAELLAGLAAHEHVEVRLFNPLPLRQGPPVLRLALSPGDFERYNHRMHNKLFVADNQFAVYGGRNVADEYFMNSAEANFIDMDVLSSGRIVRDLSAAFDSYWNSDVVWPLPALLGAPQDAAAARALFDAEVRQAAPVVASYSTDPLGRPTVEVQMAEGRVSLNYADAQVFADPPSKASDPESPKAPTAAMGGLLQAMGRARESVIIVSPYFVPTEVGMTMMRSAAAHGVKTMLFTNSLASTDEPLVHELYSRYRPEMLQLGVTIHEFNPVATRRSRGFGTFGRSTPRLHAKVAVVDHRWLLVGSVNLDARSAIGNTEMGVVIDSPLLARELNVLMGGDRFASVYRLRLAADRAQVEWLAIEPDGSSTVFTSEPGLDAWHRFKIWLQLLLVDEKLL